MGADNFATFSTGDTAKEAFFQEVEEAHYWYGHGGYTGTIAEKDEFIMLGTVTSREEAEKIAEYYDLAMFPHVGWPKGMEDQRDKMKAEYDALPDTYKTGFNPYEDKWGPAGCIEIDPPFGNREYFFFGSASS